MHPSEFAMFINNGSANDSMRNTVHLGLLMHFVGIVSEFDFENYLPAYI